MLGFSKDKQVLQWIHRTAPEARGYVAAFTVVRVLHAVNGVGFAMGLRRLVDSAVAGSHSAFWDSVWLFAALILFQAVLTSASRYLGEKTQTTVENGLKLRLFDSLLRKNYGQVTAVHSGEWMTRLTSDTTVVAGGVTHILPDFAGMVAKMVASMGVMLVLLPGFTAVLMLGGFLVALSTVWMRKYMKRLHRRIQESDGRLRIFLTERLGSLMVLKAYQQEKSAEAEARSLMEEHQRARMRKNHFSNVCNTAFSLAMNCAFGVGAGFCGYGILTGTISYGTFTAVVQLVGQIQSPLAGITAFAPRYYTMLASAERLMEAENFQEPDRDGPWSPEAFQGFGLREISYTYPDGDSGGRGLVRDFSMQVKKGEFVAFTGPSGCGKSTVLKLLLCLYEPDSGSRYVMADGKEIPLKGSWSRLFAYVPQGNQLMSGTIRQIITFGRPEGAENDREIWKSLEIARAADFVKALPLGLDTELGERGCGLSEGQLQRLAIARALFSGRPVLLLDESTSALDGESEVRVLENIRALTGKTVLIVTHRPAALGVADKVVRFAEDGISLEQR